ncbi:MAG: FMN-binding protein, partial [Clostridia bacterium]|nr:FMN-binding protein [Clostridia bacterium]
MKKRILTLCLALVMLVGMTASVQAQPAEATAFTPGTYRAEAMGHNATIVLDVTFSQDAITGIEVVQHNESKTIGDLAMEEMSAEILERQSLNVDTIAGATITGIIFRNIVTDAV